VRIPAHARLVVYVNLAFLTPFPAVHIVAQHFIFRVCTKSSQLVNLAPIYVYLSSISLCEDRSLRKSCPIMSPDTAHRSRFYSLVSRNCYSTSDILAVHTSDMFYRTAYSNGNRLDLPFGHCLQSLFGLIGVHVGPRTSRFGRFKRSGRVLTGVDVPIHQNASHSIMQTLTSNGQL
jgi:hypothetical protein